MDLFIALVLVISSFVLSSFMGFKTNKLDDELGFSVFVLNFAFVLFLFGVFIGTAISGNWGIGLYLLFFDIAYLAGYMEGVLYGHS